MLRSSKMNQIPIWVLFISFSLLFNAAKPEEDEVIRSLINFLGKLSNKNGQPDPSMGWNLNSDPCKDKWKGVACDSRSISVKKLLLNEMSLAGTLDARSLCNNPSLAESLNVLNLNDNNIGGEIPNEIANCKQLARLQLTGNQFSGNLPGSLSMLINLKRLEISNNNFSGNLPELNRSSGLTMFLSQNNQLTGEIPKFDFSNLVQFNVSFNNFSGPIPNVDGRFSESSFLGNPELCGEPLPNKCPPSSPWKKKSKGVSKNQILMYSGYFILGLAFIIAIIFRLFKRKKAKEEKVEAATKAAAADSSSNKLSAAPSESTTGVISKLDFSVISAENSVVSSSLVVLTSPVVNGLRFEDLLKAPAELLGRGKQSSLYKVIVEGGVALAVKRIKDWEISSDDFKQRMGRIDQVKHPNVLPAVAFYCSKQEKLLVYEYQQNGSLCRLLQGTQIGQAFDWGSRLSVAASIAEALAFMHQELREDGIAHGNLKCSNILLNKNMEPCISEYGLIVVDNQDHSSLATEQSGAGVNSTFEVDIYGFGVILLELLTGKVVQNNGFDLTRWVHSVVQEEWTGEVFNKTLISEGASEERMVNLLQVALKCINLSPEARPSISQVAVMINTIREEEERSVVSEV